MFHGTLPCRNCCNLSLLKDFVGESFHNNAEAKPILYVAPRHAKVRHVNYSLVDRWVLRPRHKVAVSLWPTHILRRASAEASILRCFHLLHCYIHLCTNVVPTFASLRTNCESFAPPHTGPVHWSEKNIDTAHFVPVAIKYEAAILTQRCDLKSIKTTTKMRANAHQHK